MTHPRHRGKVLSIVLARLVAMVSALLVIPLALINWVHFGDPDAYISGRDSDVVFSFGDGYAIVALGGIVILARVTRTAWPRLDWLFAWVCTVSGLGITAISAAVLFRDWAGERMWTLSVEPLLGILLAFSGALLLTLRQQMIAADELSDETEEMAG